MSYVVQSQQQHHSTIEDDFKEGSTADWNQP